MIFAAGGPLRGGQPHRNQQKHDLLPPEDNHTKNQKTKICSLTIKYMFFAAGGPMRGGQPHVNKL